MEVRRINPDELYHHGVKGQRWGVRRYQNADGTLTAAGKRHYNTTNNELSVNDYKRYEKKVNTSAANKSVAIGSIGMIAAAGAVVAIGNTPLALAAPLIGLGHMFATAAISTKLADKKINDARASMSKRQKELLKKYEDAETQRNDLVADYIKPSNYDKSDAYYRAKIGQKQNEMDTIRLTSELYAKYKKR